IRGPAPAPTSPELDTAERPRCVGLSKEYGNHLAKRRPAKVLRRTILFRGGWQRAVAPFAPRVAGRLPIFRRFPEAALLSVRRKGYTQPTFKDPCLPPEGRIPMASLVTAPAALPRPALIRPARGRRRPLLAV